MASNISCECHECSYVSDEICMGYDDDVLYSCGECQSIVLPKPLPYRYDCPHCPKCHKKLLLKERLHPIRFGTWMYKCPRCKKESLVIKYIGDIYISSEDPIESLIKMMANTQDEVKDMNDYYDSKKDIREGQIIHGLFVGLDLLKMFGIINMTGTLKAKLIDSFNGIKPYTYVECVVKRTKMKEEKDYYCEVSFKSEIDVNLF